MEAESKDPQEPVPTQLPDWFLQTLVRLANQTGVRMSVTLSTAGGLITGDLMSAEDYFKSLVSVLSAAKDAEGKNAETVDTLTELFSKFGEEVRESPDNEPDQDLHSPRYIHLANAHYLDVSGNRIPGLSPGMAWRGRIALVAGFSVGRMDPAG